jgi:hypothetical protein
MVRTNTVGLPPNVGLTVREFVAAAVRLAGLSAAFISGEAKSQASAAEERSNLVIDTTRLQLGSATIEISFGPGGFDVPREAIIAWVSKAAHAVARYYRVFPVPLMRIRILSAENRSGAFGGETWGTDPPFTRVFVGQNTTTQQLADDWLMTHELVHTAFPNVARKHHWIEEGIATYVEPVARAQIGDLTPKMVWGGMIEGMPEGEPKSGDTGLDHTHTWGRTYWGGALFCLLADVRIRQATNNRRGLQHALCGIRDAGGTIVHSWPIARAFEVGDEASRTKVLTTLYSEMKDKPVHVDLNTLWHELGVNSLNDLISLSDRTPLAAIRRAITSAKSI